MAPLPGMYGDKPPQVTDQGVLEAHSIGNPDPSHGKFGDTSNQTWPSAFGTGYGGTQYGDDIPVDMVPEFNQGGRKMDVTPTTHQAPYPRGIIQPDLETPGSYAASATALTAQRRALHGISLGAARFFNMFAPGGREAPVDITVDRYSAPNANMLASGIPGQLRQGNNGVARDTTQAYGKLNESSEEFNAGHSIRIVQHDTLHFDRSLDNAPPQPFWGRHAIQQTRFDGPDSPYGQVAGDTSTGQQIVWEGRIGTPTSYQQPPEPDVNQNVPDSSGDVWAYYG